MIGRLSGEVLECSPEELLLDVGGVGYRVRIPLSTYYAVVSKPAARASLHVHTHVREDALVLYGFATPDERRAFERLITISGIGPKVALSVLSGIETSDLDRAVRENDRVRLERIPGIGRKTAERILLELRSRDDRSGGSARGRGGASGDPGIDPTTPGRGLRDDAVSALVNLGYGAEAAARAVEAAAVDEGEGARLEAVLRRALRLLLR